jgi:hypothetical protein
MGDVRPIIIYGNPTFEQLEMLREAKQSLGVNWLSLVNRAEPGVVGNIVAFESVPFFVNGGIAYLRPPYTVARMAAALRQVFGIDPPTHLVQPALWLEQILAPGVNAVGVRELEREE